MIDTLKAVDQLHDHGFTHDQSRALVAVISQQEERLATKHDIALVQSDIASLRTWLEAKFESADKERSTLKWLVGVTITIASISLAVAVAGLLRG